MLYSGQNLSVKNSIGQQITPKLCEREVRFLYIAHRDLSTKLMKFQVDPFLQFLFYALDRIFSETTSPTDVRFRIAPPWDRGKDGKLNIKMIKVICCYSFLSTPGGGGI